MLERNGLLLLLLIFMKRQQQANKNYYPFAAFFSPIHSSNRIDNVKKVCLAVTSLRTPQGFAG